VSLANIVSLNFLLQQDKATKSYILKCIADRKDVRYSIRSLHLFGKELIGLCKLLITNFRLKALLFSAK